MFDWESNGAAPYGDLYEEYKANVGSKARIDIPDIPGNTKNGAGNARTSHLKTMATLVKVFPRCATFQVESGFAHKKVRNVSVAFSDIVSGASKVAFEQ